MELYLVRHGESLSNLGLQNSPDSPLSPLGEEQVELLGRRLALVRFDRIFTSHLKRAVQTAAAVARHQGGLPEIDVIPDLATNLRGVRLKPDAAFLRTVYPQLVYAAPLIGAAYHGNVGRARAVLERCAYRFAYPDADVTERRGEDEIRFRPGKILIVSHSGFGMFLLDELAGLHTGAGREFVQNSTCVNRFLLFFRNGVPSVRVLGYNDVSHLPERLCLWNDL
ncbi:MAG: histidine phosphatase family protein [Oscillospiraceae bacterium]|nr:histidine phosphatase family protein [Oscillospiraceae bacterium]